MNLNIAISFLTLFLTLVLSCLVLLADYKNLVNRYFFLLGLSIAGWIGSSTIADLGYSYNSALFFSRMAIIWPPLFPIFLNGLISRLYYFRDHSFGKKFRIFTVVSIIIAIIILGLSQTNLNIQSITIESWGTDYQPGLLYYLLFTYLLVGFTFFFVYLFKFYYKSIEPQKSQARFMILGAFVATFIAVLSNIILPLMGYGFASVVGPSAVLFFVGFTAIAVLKHNLFNIKVIATELITFALWIFILIRALIATTLQETLIEAGLLLVTIIFGIFLIKSVIKEVAQREKIEKLAKDLQKANDRLKELDKQKSEFVGFATHQLRAPLTSMKGYASLIMEGDAGESSPKIREFVSRIYDSANTLTAIVADYLNLTQIELHSMKFNFETVDLKELVENVIAELKPNIQKSKLEFSFKADTATTDYRVHADKDKLKQVIANLIDNSMKYTPKGSIAATLFYDRPRRKLTFQVKDTGIGISPEILPKLFQKWSRANNANKTNIKGTGLGLYVAKEIITAHKGVIRAESDGEGKGSSFIVQLDPLSKV